MEVALRPTRLMGWPRASAPGGVTPMRSCSMLHVFGQFRALCCTIRLSHIAPRRLVGGKPRQAPASRGLPTHCGRCRPGLRGAYTISTDSWALWTPRGPLFRTKVAEGGGPEPRRCNTSAIVPHVAGFGPKIGAGSILPPLPHRVPSARLGTRGKAVKHVQQGTQYPRCAIP